MCDTPCQFMNMNSPTTKCRDKPWTKTDKRSPTKTAQASVWVTTRRDDPVIIGRGETVVIERLDHLIRPVNRTLPHYAVGYVCTYVYTFTRHIAVD